MAENQCYIRYCCNDNDMPECKYFAQCNRGAEICYWYEHDRCTNAYANNEAVEDEMEEVDL